MKVDFVLPWVNPLDIEWQKSKLLYEMQYTDQVSNSASRYRDMGTLKYVLRSIETNCPWYHKIFLITANQVPDWLNRNSPNVVLVDHSDLYYDKSHLPTFNSSSIEMNLPNIENLSDNFVYLNDDCFIINKLSPERFFKNNLPVDFFVSGWIPRNRFLDKVRPFDAWVHSINNNLNLINSEFSISSVRNELLFQKSYGLKNLLANLLMRFVYRKLIWLRHWHHPQPYNKTTLAKVRELYSQEMDVCSANRFRSDNDLTHYLYRYYHLITGNFEPYYFNDALNLVSFANKVELKSMIDVLNRNKSINFVCFNDGPKISEKEFPEINKLVNEFLGVRFKYKASFEK